MGRVAGHGPAPGRSGSLHIGWPPPLCRRSKWIGVEDRVYRPSRHEDSFMRRSLYAAALLVCAAAAGAQTPIPSMEAAALADVRKDLPKGQIVIDDAVLGARRPSAQARRNGQPRLGRDTSRQCRGSMEDARDVRELAKVGRMQAGCCRGCERECGVDRRRQRARRGVSLVAADSELEGLRPRGLPRGFRQARHGMGRRSTLD